MSDREWHDMAMYNLIMPQKSMIKLYNIKSISHHYTNLPTVCVKITLSSRPTHPVSFISKCLICEKSMVIKLQEI